LAAEKAAAARAAAAAAAERAAALKAHAAALKAKVAGRIAGAGGAPSTSTAAAAPSVSGDSSLAEAPLNAMLKQCGYTPLTTRLVTPQQSESSFRGDSEERVKYAPASPTKFRRRTSVTRASQQELATVYSARDLTVTSSHAVLEKCGYTPQQSESTYQERVKYAPASPTTDVPWKQAMLEDIYDNCGYQRQEM